MVINISTSENSEETIRVRIEHDTYPPTSNGRWHLMLGVSVIDGGEGDREDRGLQWVLAF